MQKSRINKLSQMFAKLAADKDAKELKKINLGKLREGNIPEGEEPRDYYQRLNQEAEQGPIFSANTIFSIQSIPETSLPKNRKPFVLWLANELEKNQNPINIKDLDDLSEYVDGNNISDFSGLNLNQLIEESKKWHQSFTEFTESTESPEEMGEYSTKNIVDFLGNGYVIVSLPEEDLKIEGELMGNCVGKIHHPNTYFFSLRDAKNKPHVTISLKNTNSGLLLNEVKGKQNVPPSSKYSLLIRNWIEQKLQPHQYEDSADFKGLITFDEYLKLVQENNIDAIEDVAVSVGDRRIIAHMANNYMQNEEIVTQMAQNLAMPLEILFEIFNYYKDNFDIQSYVLEQYYKFPEDFLLNLVRETDDFDYQLSAEDGHLPEEVLKEIFLKENSSLLSENQADIRENLAEKITDLDFLKYVFENYHHAFKGVIQNKNFQKEIYEMLKEGRDFFITLLVKNKFNERIPFHNDVINKLISLEGTKISEVAKAIKNTMQEDIIYNPERPSLEVLEAVRSFKRASRADVVKKSQDLSSELEELMDKLTGDSMPDESNQKPDQSPAQQFQEIIESNQQAIYQLPVRHGKKGVPLIDDRGQETGEKPWIVGTFIPSVKINERHPQGHNGVDLASNRGTPIYPIGPGEVIEQRNYSKGGITVKVSHEDGKVISYYAHLDSANVSPGAKVGPNTQLGTMGDTGNAKGTNPHLHFEVSVDGKKIDPMSIMGQPVGSLSKKAEIIKEIGSILNKYAKDRGDLLKDLLKNK